MSSSYINAEGLTAGILMFYLIFYTCYDKVQKRIEPRTLKHLIFCEISFMHTLKEINKILGLASLTLIGIAFALPFYSTAISTILGTSSLLSYGINIGRVHGIFSMIEFKRRYGDSSYVLAMLLGSLTFWATFLLEGVLFPQIPVVNSFFVQISLIGAENKALSSFALVSLGLAHVLLMERSRESKWGFLKPQMRPAGFFSLICSGCAMLFLGLSLL